MVFGWQLINGKWYWFKWDGIMRTGWHLINNQWYYMDEDGTTVQNETRMINGVQYRFDANGAWIG
jgi:glucan-binding YG repeat protein